MDTKEAQNASEDVARYLAEEGAPRQIGQIAKATGLEWTEARSALERLRDADRATSEGRGIAQKWVLAESEHGRAAEGVQPEVTEADPGEPDQESGPAAPIDTTDLAARTSAEDGVTAEAIEIAPPATAAAPTPIPNPVVGYVWLVLGDVDDATVGYLHERTGYSHGQVLKALWALWEAGLASSTGRLRPDRGQWHRVTDVDETRVAEVSPDDVPAKVTCFVCGNVQALQYKPSQAKAVALYDPDEPVPAELAEREVPVRAPEVLFCAEILDRTDSGVAVLTARTGYAKPVVVRALWALRRHGLVACTDPHSIGGGTWSAAKGMFDRASYVSLADAPAAIGCGECGRSVPLRGNAGGKVTRGVPRANTGDGGTPLPNGSLNSMIKAWAMDSRDLNESSRTVTATQLYDLLCSAAESGELAAWLTAWAKAFGTDRDAARVPRVLAALDSGDRPRSSGAVVNALRRLSREDPPPVSLVRDIVAETYRAEPDYAAGKDASA